MTPNEPTVIRSAPLVRVKDGRMLWMAIGSLADGEAKYEAAPELEEGTMQIPMLDEIITGDARELAKQIPDCSIDLVFADPVYDRLEDYEWLAETAARVLKPDRACLVWCSNIRQYDVQPVISPFLRFVFPLSYTKIAKSYALYRYKTFVWSTPCLWFQKGNFTNDWTIDTVVDVMQGNSVVTALAPPSDTYKWHKNPEAYISWLKAFTKPGDVVWDPFTGSGSLPVECKRLDRRFIASEIKPEIAEIARQRVAAVETIHPAFIETQESFSDAL